MPIRACAERLPPLRRDRTLRPDPADGAQLRAPVIQRRDHVHSDEAVGAVVGKIASQLEAEAQAAARPIILRDAESHIALALGVLDIRRDAADIRPTINTAGRLSHLLGGDGFPHGQTHLRGDHRGVYSFRPLHLDRCQRESVTRLRRSDVKARVFFRRIKFGRNHQRLQ